MDETQLISERQLAGMVIVRLAQTLALELGADQSVEKTATRIVAVAQLCRATMEANDDGEFERQKKCGESAMSMIGYIAKGNNPYKL